MKHPVIRILALLILIAGYGWPPAHGADGAAEKKKELQRIKREMQEKKLKIERADKKERSILADIERIDKSIQAGSAELFFQQKRLVETETALKAVETNSAETQRDLARLQGAYRDRLRALYKMGRSGSPFVVLSADSVTAAAKRFKYLGVIAARDRAIITEYGQALDSLAGRQAEIAEKKEETTLRRQAIKAKQAELGTRRAQKADILAAVKKQKGLHEQALRELDESSASLWAMIRKAEQEKKAVRAASPPAGASAIRTPASGKGRLPWPVDGELVTPFGRQRHPQFGTVVFRRGIELKVREGEAVRAVEGGQVAYADWYKGYGKLLILEHGAGLYSLYGYLSRLDVNRGDTVAAGQVIGLAGDTGSLKGPKLYFEIRRNGEAQDPLLWLARR